MNVTLSAGDSQSPWHSRFTPVLIPPPGAGADQSPRRRLPRPPKAANFWRLQPNDLRDQHLVHIEKEQTTAVRIRSLSQAEVVLDRQGDTWMLTRFGKTEPANKERVTKLFDTLNATPVQEFLSDSAGNLEPWGLQKPFLSIEWEAGGKTSTLEFGRSPKSIFTARLRDEPYIYRPKTFYDGIDIFSAIPPDSLRWRHTKVINVSVLAVRRIIVADGDRPAMTLLHNPDDASWQGNIAGRDVTPQIDTERANQLLQRLAELQASDWNSERSGALVALKNPSLTIQLLVADRRSPTAEPKPVRLTFAPLQPAHGHRAVPWTQGRGSGYLLHLKGALSRADRASGEVGPEWTVDG